MEKNKDLLVIGHTALDYIIKVDEFPKANYSTSINDMKTFNGGAAANVAIVGATLGLKTGLVSAIGNEFKNTNYYKQLKELYIDTDYLIEVPNETNPTAFVLTNKNNDQISYFYWGASKIFKESKAPKKAISESKAIHLSTGSPEFNWKCSIESKKQDLLISFDPGQDLGLYTSKQLEEIIRNTTILFGNHHEINRITTDLETDIQGLKELGPEIIIKTCGAKGSEIYCKNEKIQIEAIPSNAVDPTGAGDSYRAGFLSRFLNGESVENSAKFASAVSSFIIQEQGCQTNIPSFNTAFETMKEFY